MDKRLHDVKILAVVGLAGAGKSEVVEHISKKGFPKVYFGGVVLQAVKDAGLDITPDNERMMREKLRAEEGNDVVANRIVRQINDLIDAGQRHVIADGLYSWTEYKILKHEFPGKLELISVVAPRPLRYHRLEHRPIRPLTRDEAQTRDWSEIENLEKGGPIAIADHFIIKDGNIADLNKNTDAILEEIDFVK
jgi:dephospho-CoA kinase